jgi:hypothetical protein
MFTKKQISVEALYYAKTYENDFNSNSPHTHWVRPMSKVRQGLDLGSNQLSCAGITF